MKGDTHDKSTFEQSQMNDEKQVIVFGGSGFLGSHVADALSEKGYRVKIFDTVCSPWLRSDQEMIVGDIMDIDAVIAAARGCSYIYHFAGISDISATKNDPLTTTKINVLGTVNTLEASRIVGASRYLFASTIYVYSNRGSFYRASKQSAERFIETYHDEYGLNYTILRYGSLYGRRADDRNMIHCLLRNALQGKPMSYPGSGEELREYIHVRDAAEASVCILAEEFANKHVILTGNEKLRVKDLTKMISEILGGDVQAQFTGKEEDGGHYSVTPYSFTPTFGRKFSLNQHIDMGQGITDCLAELHQRFHADAEPKEDWLIENQPHHLP